jgi:hypothetical protein
MVIKTATTFYAKIYLAGSLETIKNVCREYCKQVGLCVTVSETLFIYTGGEEYGVEIGLLNYPRFPDTDDSIFGRALELAGKCRDAAFQHSYLVITPEDTIWNSTRETT